MSLPALIAVPPTIASVVGSRVGIGRFQPQGIGMFNGVNTHRRPSINDTAPETPAAAPATGAGPAVNHERRLGVFGGLASRVTNAVGGEQKQRNRALLAAADRGDATAVDTLLPDGPVAKADVNSRSRTYGHAPLHIAAKNGHTEVVKLLLDKGADPNLENGNNTKTPLYYAVEKQHLDVVKTLRRHGGARNTEVRHYGEDPLNVSLRKLRTAPPEARDVAEQIKRNVLQIHSGQVGPSRPPSYAGTMFFDAPEEPLAD